MKKYLLPLFFFSMIIHGGPKKNPEKKPEETLEKNSMEIESKLEEPKENSARKDEKTENGLSKSDMLALTQSMGSLNLGMPEEKKLFLWVIRASLESSLPESSGVFQSEKICFSAFLQAMVEHFWAQNGFQKVDENSSMRALYSLLKFSIFPSFSRQHMENIKKLFPLYDETKKMKTEFWDNEYSLWWLRCFFLKKMEDKGTMKEALSIKESEVHIAEILKKAEDYRIPFLPDLLTAYPYTPDNTPPILFLQVGYKINLMEYIFHLSHGKKLTSYERAAKKSLKKYELFYEKKGIENPIPLPNEESLKIFENLKISQESGKTIFYDGSKNPQNTYNRKIEAMLQAQKKVDPEKLQNLLESAGQDLNFLIPINQGLRKKNLYRRPLYSQKQCPKLFAPKKKIGTRNSTPLSGGVKRTHDPMLYSLEYGVFRDLHRRFKQIGEWDELSKAALLIVHRCNCHPGSLSFPQDFWLKSIFFNNFLGLNKFHKNLKDAMEKVQALKGSPSHALRGQWLLSCLSTEDLVKVLFIVSFKGSDDLYPFLAKELLDESKFSKEKDYAIHKEPISQKIHHIFQTLPWTCKKHLIEEHCKKRFTCESDFKKDQDRLDLNSEERNNLRKNILEFKGFLKNNHEKYLEHIMDVTNFVLTPPTFPNVALSKKELQWGMARLFLKEKFFYLWPVENLGALIKRYQENPNSNHWEEAMDELYRVFEGSRQANDRVRMYSFHDASYVTEAYANKGSSIQGLYLEKKIMQILGPISGRQRDLWLERHPEGLLEEQKIFVIEKIERLLSSPKKEAFYAVLEACEKKEQSEEKIWVFCRHEILTRRFFRNIEHHLTKKLKFLEKGLFCNCANKVGFGLFRLNTQDMTSVPTKKLHLSAVFSGKSFVTSYKNALEELEVLRASKNNKTTSLVDEKTEENKKK